MALFKRLLKSLRRILLGKRVRRVRRKPNRKYRPKRRTALEQKKTSLRKIKKLNKRPKLKKTGKAQKPKSAPKRKPVPKPKSKPIHIVKTEKTVVQGLLIGEITHYFSRIGVGVIKLSASINVGDHIQIRGNGRDFKQTVRSLQIESVDVKSATKGHLVGLKLDQEAREGDQVYRMDS